MHYIYIYIYNMHSMHCTLELASKCTGRGRSEIFTYEPPTTVGTAVYKHLRTVHDVHIMFSSLINIL